MRTAGPLHVAMCSVAFTAATTFSVSCSDPAPAAQPTGQAFVVDGGQMIRGLVPVESKLPSTHGLYASGSAAARA